MMKYKSNLFFILISLICITLVACGSNNETNKKNDEENGMTDIENENNNIEGDQENQGIVAGSIEPSATITNIEGNDITIIYRLKNQTESVKEFTFRTSQQFDYDLYSEDGKLLKRFSEDKDFLQVMKYFTLKQGEELEIPIKIHNLEPGHYTLIVWLTSDGDGKEDYKLEVPFEIPNN
jgi:uncharacterized protein YcfL